MRRLSLIHHHQQGDTIVEVLLAIVVVSSVLAGAFVSVNRSFIGGRQSQERGEAVKLVEGQLERLKQAAKDPTNNIFGPGPTPYCLNDTLTRTASASPVCNQGADSRYRLTIEQDPTDANTFIAMAVWTRFGGDGQDQVRMVYRVYQND